MLSLYFNTKLFPNNLKPYAASVNSDFFYPIVYPRDSQKINESQLDIFLKSIRSLSCIEFKNAIFNIDIDELNDPSLESLIEKNIYDFCNADYIEINFSRPFSIESWKLNITKYSNIFDKDSPVLVIMNHDHLFVDYTEKPFIKTINKIFTNDNFGKAFIYTHCPEAISWIFHSRNNGHYKFHKFVDDIYKSDIVNDHIDSICIMTMETLLHIFTQVKLSGSYIGRIEWKGATHCELNLTFFASTREFFKHYDGYGHVTGTNQISDLRSTNKSLNFKNSSNSIDSMAHFYFQCWKDAFYLFLRDNLYQQIIYVEPIKKIYISSIEESINLFTKSYIEVDKELNLITSKQALAIENELRNLVYRNANYLFADIMTDIRLMQPGIFSRLRHLIYKLPLISSFFLKKIISKFIS